MGNPVRKAVAVLGSVERVAVAAQVSAASVYAWLQWGRIPQTRHAVAVEDATDAAGTRVSVRELAGLARRQGR